MESLALLPGGKGGYSVKLVDLNRGDHEPVGSGRGAVLIVDDEDMVRLVCRAMVQGLGYSTMVASDGA